MMESDIIVKSLPMKDVSLANVRASFLIVASLYDELNFCSCYTESNTWKSSSSHPPRAHWRYVARLQMYSTRDLELWC